MAGQGMGTSANCGMSLVVFLLLFTSAAGLAVQRATYVVGGTKEWAAPALGNTYNSTYLQDWANTIVFAVNDTLVFTYSSLAHDVLQVNVTSYANCVTSSPIKSYHSGNDSVLIAAGTTLFICGTPGHCGLGQKVNITTNVTTNIITNFITNITNITNSTTIP